MTTPPMPYAAFAPGQSAMRMFYTSVCQVLRAGSSMTDGGAFTLSWTPVTTVVDPVFGQPGLLQCRLDLLFVRPGKDQMSPLVAGRAPDRIGVCYFDLAQDADGSPLVKSADRLQCVSGPVFGTFDIRLIPDVAIDLIGGHHVEVQVIEVSQMLKPPSPIVYPGSPP